MTSEDCPTGTDRLIEVLRNYPEHHPSIVVNVQGDVPSIEPEVIQQVIDILVNDRSAVMSTAAMKIHTEEEAINPSVVKCVLDKHNNALYFSRGLIPHGHSGAYAKTNTYYHHIGIYAYHSDFLLQHYGQLPISPLQQAEDLEQLKVLEHGFKIKVAIVKSESFGVDTKQDIHKMEQLICKLNTYLSQAESAPL